MNRKFRIALAAALLLLGLLIWLVLSRLLAPPAKPDLRPTSQADPASKPPAPTQLASASTEPRPAYIVEGNVVKVEVPGVGWVTGIKHPDIELVKFRERKMVPEILVTDAEGHFIYLRTHPPLYKSSRDFAQWQKALEEEWQDRYDDKGQHYPAPRILSLGKQKLSNPAVLSELSDHANRGLTAARDTEIWGVQFIAPLQGEQDGFLVARTSGRADGGMISVPDKTGLTRKLEFYAYSPDEGFFRPSSAGAEVFEEWIGKSPISEAEHREGEAALERNARRMFVEPAIKPKGEEQK